MKNIKPFFLTFSLLSFVSTQCMKRDYSSLINKETNTLYQIQEIHDKIKDVVFNACCDVYIDNPLFEYHHKYIIEHCDKNQERAVEQRKFNFQGYSYLGLAVLGDYTTFDVKQCFIHRLLTFKFVPTDKDKEAALLEKWERCSPSIIKKIWQIRYIKPISMLEEIPQKIMDRIATLAFWTNFDKEESLL